MEGRIEVKLLNLTECTDVLLGRVGKGCNLNPL